MQKQEITALEAELGHRFRSPELLEQALTHSSHAHESESREAGTNAAADNEQLEFLGDAVLGFVTSETLFERFPQFHEGQLSKLRAHLVSARHLFDVAGAIDLGQYLRLGRGEEKSGGRSKSALLANTLEAVLAALYLDGGIGPARNFILARIVDPELERLENENEAGLTISDHKSALQEYLQAAGSPQPSYSVVKEEGPEHNKTFTVELRVQARPDAKTVVSRGRGPTKKGAEQRAAQEVLARLREPTRAQATSESDRHLAHEPTKH
jgi:ribonuclease-3